MEYVVVNSSGALMRRVNEKGLYIKTLNSQVELKHNWVFKRESDAKWLFKVNTQIIKIYFNLKFGPFDRG